MSIFQCSECGGTFRYKNDSPAEWKPMMLGQPGSLPKTCCSGCYPQVQQVSQNLAGLAGSAGTCALRRVVWGLLARVAPQYPSERWVQLNFGTGADNYEKAAKWLEGMYPTAWREVYLAETGKEWQSS